MEGVEELLAGYLDRVALALGRHILLKYTVFLRQIHKEIHCIFEKIHKEMHCILKNKQNFKYSDFLDKSKIKYTVF